VKRFFERILVNIRVIKTSRFLAFSLIHLVSFAQNPTKTDSLLVVLEKEVLTTKERAKILEAISFNHPKLDSALFYAKKSLVISLDFGDKILLAEAYEAVGGIEQRLGNDTKSLEAAFLALKIYEQLDLQEEQAAVYNLLAVNYSSQKEYSFAVNYLEKAYLIYRNSNTRMHEAITLVNLGEVYRLSGNLDKAEDAFNRTIELNKFLDEDSILAYSLGNLGMIYAAKNDFDYAIQNLTEAIKILTVLNDDYSVSIYLSELALIYKKENKYDLAESKLLEAFEMSENAGLKEQSKDFSAMLVALYEEKNNFQKALAYQKVYQTYQDSLVNKSNIKKIEQIKASYEIDKREVEIEKINVISANRKSLAISSSIGLIIFAALAFLLYKFSNKVKLSNRKLLSQKAEITQKEKEKSLLLNELNHRVKNNLQIVSSLLNLQSNTVTDVAAKEFINSGKNRVEALSLVHRKLYQEGIETKVEVKPYVEELVLNLLHVYNTNLKPEFNIVPISIGVDKAIPLALIINELVTNTLKHAFTSIANPKLDILIKQQQNYLCLEVFDNGRGFSKEESTKVDSLGLKLISSLVNQLDGTYKTFFESGTRWVINLNIK
jgi:two-component sensor histidine kinase/Flp pilus assembly protein TadD